MRVEKWDILMHRLLTEKKEKQLKEKAFAGKKELDNDEDGVPKWADKDDSDSKVGSKGSKKKKGKGKIPAQLKMHIKKKKSKLDEQIEKLEKILFEELTDVTLDEYGEDRHPDIEDDDDDFEDDLPSYDEEDFGDYGEESMRKFAQKSKDFADKYTEEDDYEEEEEEDYEDEDDFEDDDIDLDDEDDYDDEEDFMEEGVEYLSEAEVKKKKPRLGKVTRNPSGSKKKFHVYVKCGGRVKKISFGDPGLSIKRDSAARRKNFRARHKCDKPAGKDRCTARYWSCYQWRAGKKVEGEE
jgi:hypothetical protein